MNGGVYSRHINTRDMQEICTITLFCGKGYLLVMSDRVSQTCVTFLPQCLLSRQFIAQHMSLNFHMMHSDKEAEHQY